MTTGNFDPSHNQEPVDELELIRIFQEDKARYNELFLGLYSFEVAHVDEELPEGFLFSNSVAIYPPSVRFISLLALKMQGFDIRFIGPVIGKDDPEGSDLQDEVRTAVKPEEYDKIAKILFKSATFEPKEQLSRGMNGDQTNLAPRLLGHPTTDGTAAHKPNVWYLLLDYMLRAKVYFEGGHIFNPSDWRVTQSGLAEHHTMLMEEGVLPKAVMTSHINHDLVHRNRPYVPEVSITDMKIYKMLKDNGFEPYGPEEIIGIARRMVREILEEHPEWSPASREIK